MSLAVHSALAPAAPPGHPGLPGLVHLASYQQDYRPVGDSLGWSSLIAVLPLLVLFVLLGVLRMRAWLASLIGLAVALLLAITVYSMPAGDAFDSGLLGAAFGFFPIMWIVINAIWVHNLTVQTGHFDVLRRSFASVSDDQRVQAVIIAFCFGALMEALAGFGTPVAMCSVMLIALGFRPLKAATVALVANTAPVAFGAIAVPITTLAGVTGMPVDDLGSMVGRQTPVLALFVPLALVFIVDGRRGLRQTWQPAVLCGVVFAVFQYLASNFWSVQLADIIAALASALALLALTRVWHAAEPYQESDTDEEPGGTGANPPAGDGGTVPVGGTGGGPAAGGGHTDAMVLTRVESGPEPAPADSRLDVFRAYAPYLAIIVVFVLATRVPAITGKPPAKPGASGTGIESVTRIVNWPGLHITNADGNAVATTFKLNYLSAAGSLLLISGLLSMALLGVGARRALAAYGRTLDQLKFAVLTVMLVLALGYIMNESGETTTLGLWAAGAGGAFALLSPLLGWLGTAVTGSDTSSNSLFGTLQVTAAHQAGLSPLLMAAANSSGGVLGKMISPQNLAIAAAAVGYQGREGVIFRRVFLWSVVFVAFMCLLVYLQSTQVLDWMVVGTPKPAAP
ncbi:L-lactate permease [Actinacidiphila guanduensis]|uniref:L-lactate permease n=1 Tax=Actinacidiphila guanduensis TaxID=310781 RepID=A0A1G9YIV5_9ACTN|nr:L-lactate permease [Actinacidiphila guanduensis]SDN09084.1 lactate permease [Actinacidiphila guanduensis]